jgi:hypothetical protein
MSTGETPHAASILANLDIETPTGDRLSLRGDGVEMRLVAASVAALWRTRRVAHKLLGSGVTPWVTSRLPVDVNVSVGERVVALIEPTTSGGARVRLRWMALLRALF